MQRSVKISLKYATTKKLRRLDHLLRRLRKLTSCYIDHIWQSGGNLDAATLNVVPCDHLSYRQRVDCLKYALEIVTGTKAGAKALGVIPGKPQIRKTFKFSKLTAKVEQGCGSFDYVLKISSVIPYKVITIPFKSHKRLTYWLNKPGAELLNGCIIKENKAVLWIRLPDEPTKTEGDELGIDLGYNKLLTDSNGQQYGEQIKKLCEKVRRKKPNSKGMRRAQEERRHYINCTTKQLPWDTLRLIAVENLKNLKTGKKAGRAKNFRKRMAPWTYRQALVRIEQLAQENRVRLVAVDPRNTSRECPICKRIAKENRVGERFCCINCGYTADADYVGAQNIIARTTRNSQQSMVAAPS